ncbi:MAG: BLUF domain-containing protein [Pseudorhodoplanes sp.]
MTLFRLVYHSRSNLESSRRPLSAELADILSAAIGWNRITGVTGGLIYDPYWFVQALEGERKAVEETYQRIAVDPRHHHLVVVASSVAESRRFPHWWMAAENWREAQGLFLKFEDGFDPRTLARDALLDLIEAIVHRHSAPQERAHERGEHGRRHAS